MYSLLYILVIILISLSLVLQLVERVKADKMTKEKFFCRLNELKIKAASGNEKYCRELVRFLSSHPVQLVRYQNEITALFKTESASDVLTHE